jgi:N-acetylglucosamine malate deacetylase 1
MKNLGIFKRALVLAAHTDDEFGCAGTMVRLLDAGVEVHYAAFSTCEESVPEGFPRDVLAHEVQRAAATVGIARERVTVLGYRVRHFPSERQAILEDLVRMRRQLEPDLVLLPALADIHQDHHVIAMEGLRAFKFSTVFGYELPMNTISFQHACFVALTENELAKKVAMLQAYESQQFRPYCSADFVRGLARVRGVQAGTQYAESFEVLRLVL